MIEGIVNTDSKVHMIKLKDGRIVLASNDHPRPFVHDKAKNELVASRERTRMIVSVSEDEGSTWKRLVRIDRRPASADFAGEGSSTDPFQLREMDESSEIAVQHHYPYLLELENASGDCKAVVAYTKSRLNVVSQRTSGHEIWVSCIPGL